MFVHWRDLESKSKSTAYLLENWNSSTTAPDALFSPWWSSTAFSDRLSVRPGRASAPLLLWVPALSPRTHPWKITLSPHEGFWCGRSTALSSSRVSNLGESTVKLTNRSFDRSRSKFADPRYRPRGRITKSVTVTTTYNRTILSGNAASTQYKMAKAALHLKPTFLQYPALKLTYYVQWALHCAQHYDICGSAGWLHEVQWVLCTVFWKMDMTGVYACLCEAVCDVTTVPSHLNPNFKKIGPAETSFLGLRDRKQGLMCILAGPTWSW